MNKFYLFSFLIIGIICLIGLRIDIMDIDAAQYASISREMLSTGHFLQVYDLGKDYLDKPPFLFWISAISMKIFGINNFSYKLPSFLFAIIAVISTFKLSKLFYDYKTAILASLILASSQGFFLMTHDVRTDTILMGWVIFSVWQLASWIQYKKLYHFFLGVLAIAFGMMTKGPIALLVPCFAIGSHLIIQKKIISYLFKWEYVLGIFIIFLLMLPMSWGLYKQFDLHPEKLVNGEYHVSGLRFFYWTQSFGRITGESSWNNNSNIFFLLQNMLWSFLPWIIIFLCALIFQIKILVTNKLRVPTEKEVITLGGFILTYLSLGMSKYQLPHYIFVAFPFAAILTAQFLNDLISNNKYPIIFKQLLYGHLVIFILLWIILVLILAISFDTIQWFVPALAFIGLIGLIVLFLKNKAERKILIFIFIYTSLGLNLFLNTWLYPTLLNYQAGSSVGKWISENNIPTNKIYTYKYTIWRSLNFYSKAIIGNKEDINTIKSGDYLITTKKNLSELKNQGKNFMLLYQGSDFPVTRLNLKFLNPKNRDGELERYALALIK